LITVRRAAERLHQRHRSHEVWSSFYAREDTDALASGLGNLANLEERRLRPGASVPYQPRQAVDIITYVREGSLAYQDASGKTGLLNAGEFQCSSVGRGGAQARRNASMVDTARVFEVWLHLVAGLETNQEQRRFSAAERRGSLCVIASPDGRRGSLRVHQAVILHSALLDPGQHLVHELAPGHGAWLQLVDGEVALNEIVLGPGDGAGVSLDRAVSLTAREPAEILLLDVWHQPAPA
jgi:redox-sensitive bicupin YhaK (pirin superfamily)